MTKYSLEKRIEYISLSLEELVYALKRYQSEVDRDDKNMAYYAAQKKAEEIVESSVALNQDILFMEFNHVSKSYKDSFKDLLKLNIFSEPVLKKYMKTAKLRNRLAHDYLNLSEEDTITQMKEIVKMYPNYLKKMIEWLGRK